jgi:hypothetical protein
MNLYYYQQFLSLIRKGMKAYIYTKLSRGISFTIQPLYHRAKYRRHLRGEKRNSFQHSSSQPVVLLAVA